MKRILPLFLLLVLLLTACAQTPSATPTDAATDAPTAEPTLTIEPPSSGSGVKTDYSEYVPREAVAPKYTRLSEEYTEEFRPSDDYGTVYPFVGAELYSEYGSLGEMYGIMDENGRILVDPVYSSYYILSEYHNNERICLPFYAFGKVADYLVVCGDEASSYSEADILYAIISTDGSFATDCIYQDVSASGGCIIASRAYGDTLSFDVFDAEGELLLSSEDLALRNRFSANSRPEYSDGVLTVGLKTGEYHDYTDYNDEPVEKYAVYLMDMEGNLLCGPYGEYSSPYHEGFAIAEVGDEVFQIIDRNGQPLTDTEFGSASYFQNGYSVVSNPHSILSYVIDTEGNTYLKDGEYLYIYWNGNYFRAEGANTVCFFDASLQKIYEMPLSEDWYPFGNTLYLTRYNESGFLELQHSPDGKTYRCESEDAYASMFEENGNMVISINEYRDEEWYYTFLDESFRVLSEGKGEPYEQTDIFDSSTRIVISNEGTRIYDTALNELFRLSVSRGVSVTLLNGRCMVTDSLTCRQYDADGELVFCYPLLSGTGD